MRTFISDSYEKMSREAANAVVQIMGSRQQPLICPASGDSPAGLYRDLVAKVRGKELDASSWFVVGLDEWAGMNGGDEGSCRYHLNHQFLGPAHIATEKICFFDGRVADLNAECELTERFIRERGGIDVAILGLGMNGHIGMNEPGTPAHTRSHIAQLDPMTQQVGQKYFKTERKLSGGITLGLDTLMESRNLILLISGKHKADIAHRVIEGIISEQVPGTLLRSHPQLSIYLDKDAASKLSA